MKDVPFPIPDVPPSLFDHAGRLVDSSRTKEHNDIMWSIISDAFKESKENSSSIASEKSLMDYFNEKVKELQLNQESSKLVLTMAQTWGDFVGEPIEKQSLKFFWLEECIEGGTSSGARTTFFVSGTKIWQKICTWLVPTRQSLAKLGKQH